jgi:hypothetical protein
MNKKWFGMIAAAFLYLSLFESAALAASSTIYEQSGSIYAGSLTKDSSAYIVNFSVSSITRIEFGSYTDSTFATAKTTKTNSVAGTGYTHFTSQRFNCNNTYYKATFYDSSGQVGVLKFLSGDELTNPVCDSNAEGTQPDEGGKDCDSCAIFSCPGWGEYMSGLEDIKNAIPPAPDWQNVAGIFRDTIAPRIKSDLEDVIGRTPTPPAAPSRPAAPALPDDLDTRGIQAPTGEEAPGLGESTFSKDDIEDEAPEIQFREDPSGGFKVDNPVDGLPSQEEFKQNIPNEGSATLPGDPKELENPAPFPEEQENTAPSPKDEGATAPVPKDGGAAVPFPKDEGATAPVPKDAGATAPTPGNEGATAPTPGSDSSTAPLPGGDNSTAPLPGNDGSTAPLPGGG